MPYTSIIKGRRGRTVSYRQGLVGLLAVLAFGVTGTAAADPGDATHVDAVDASVVGETLSVTGMATFVDASAPIGGDPVGDSLTPTPATDITTLTIARPDPAGPLRFTMGIADQPPTGGVPEVVHYNWDFSVDLGVPLTLQAIRSSQAEQPASADPVFRLLSCAEGSCEVVTTLTGRMEGGVVEWEVPLSAIGATEGSIIEQAGNIVSTLGASGVAWFVNFGGDDAFMDDFYTVPGARVRIGSAPAGTPEDSVALTQSATVDLADGSFAGTLPKPTEPGDHIVVAEACYGPKNCGRGSTTVTVE